MPRAAIIDSACAGLARAFISKESIETEWGECRIKPGKQAMEHDGLPMGLRRS